MSTLYGAVSLSGESLPPELDVRMGRFLTHRPALREEGVRFASGFLAARARGDGAGLPHWDPRSGLACVADARLDDRDTLAARLGLSLRPELSDAALITASYARWGEAFSEHLLGDFAVVLWSARERRLVLARDPFGIRPLYYVPISGALLFASQARALFAHPGLIPELDGLRVAEYLARVFADCERTFFRGVLRLAPGHTLIAETGRLRMRVHTPLHGIDELPKASSSEYAALFRGIFLEAVRSRTRRVASLGCLLSGGLDSTGLYGALRRLEPGREVACFSARFPDFPDVDEGPWLALVRPEPGVRRSELRVDELGPLDGIDALHELLDEPFHAPNLFIYDALLRLAAGQGITVLLDGLDGDTVVDHGYAYLGELLLRGKPRRFGRALSALRQRSGMSYRELLDSFVLGPERARLQRWLRSALGLPTGYLAPQFARASGFASAERQRAQVALSEPRSLRATHQRALLDPILPFYWEVHDKLAAARGIDHRHPYFDLRLVRFCLALPPSQRLHNGWDRVVQRRALRGLAPDSICARQSKSVWTANFERQLFARHSERIRSLIDSAASPLAPYCDLARLRVDLPRITAGLLPERILDLWCAVTLGCWLEQSPLQARQRGA